MDIDKLAAAAKTASIKMAALKTEQKNKALAEIARALSKKTADIIKANEKDINAAKKNNLAKPLLKRLRFDRKKIDTVVTAIKSLINLDDPVGATLDATELDKDLRLYKISCPIGVIGVVFESRPDALVQISTLCLKSANAVLLKGGSEAENTNKILARTINDACQIHQIPGGWLGLLETRQDVKNMLKLDNYIDLVIPRGSKRFVKYIMDNTNIPVLGHADGICHVYVDRKADLNMALRIVVDAKCQYVAVCNAAETLLVHADIADTFLPQIKTELEKKGVQIRGCQRTTAVIDVTPADPQDWSAEYLDYILSVKIVDNLEQAIEHINKFGSRHTDAIVTNDKANAEKFMNLVDSANVFCNCSTRFSDGFRYGLGAEVGISTNKIHARGPVGLKGLLTYKYKLVGTGQIVADYAQGKKKFKHRHLNTTFSI